MGIDSFRDYLNHKNLSLQALRLEDRARYDDHISSARFPVDIWSANFAYLWAHTRLPKRLAIMHSLVDGILVTWILTKRGRLYLPCLPVGGGSLAEVMSVLNQCTNYCDDWNRQTGFSHKPVIAKLSSNQLTHFQQSNEFNRQFTPKLLSGIERHLSISGLTSLTGKRFSTIRYKLNTFRRNYPDAKLRMYQPSDLENVLHLAQLWKQSAGAKHRRIQDGFYFKATIKHHEALGLENLVVELNNRIIGMTTGGVLPTGEAWGYIMKYDNSFAGLSEYLVIAMAQRIREIKPNVELINIGTDFGNQQLAMAKEKFRPVRAYQRFALHMRSSA